MPSASNAKGADVRVYIGVVRLADCVDQGAPRPAEPVKADAAVR